MKLLVFLCVIAVVAAAPAARINYPVGEGVRILVFTNDITNRGYKYGYEQTDGTKVEQIGQIINEGTKDETLAVSGSFQWTAPNGVTYTVTYTSGTEGYKPEVEEGPGLDPNLCASLLGCG